jgi:hypothetical protein
MEAILPSLAVYRRKRVRSTPYAFPGAWASHSKSWLSDIEAFESARIHANTIGTVDQGIEVEPADDDR